jgi:Ran GTPase-activating protein (RanGAP) involved in mRNA processing and transport
MTDKGICIAAASPNFSNLEVLNLNNSMKKKNNRITDESLHELAYSKYIKKLKVLELRNTDITSKGITSLSMTLCT